MTISITCPSCDKKINWDNQHPHKPFCSERCKLVDLGDWASEKYSIAGEKVTPTDEEFS